MFKNTVVTVLTSYCMAVFTYTGFKIPTSLLHIYTFATTARDDIHPATLSRIRYGTNCVRKSCDLREFWAELTTSRPWALNMGLT